MHISFEFGMSSNPRLK
uniref:Uncharacterized protein n=1 Tax=Anguilla anguilla TaxID=7936 RepID=A0A0E9XGL5_ANGAN